MSRVLAADIGASSYRVIEGVYEGRTLSMKELARFRHCPVCENGHYYWDIYAMRDNLVRVIRDAAKQGDKISSIGFDTFGTDFGLLDEDEKLLMKPLAYRDGISDGIYEKYFQNEEALYARTGGTYATASTAHILKGMAEHGLPSLKKARYLLMMPDLLSWMFTGNITNEYTIATSSRLLNIHHSCWDKELITALRLPADIFQPLTESGTIVGRIKKEIAGDIPNLDNTVVTAAACHDTAYKQYNWYVDIGRVCQNVEQTGTKYYNTKTGRIRRSKESISIHDIYKCPGFCKAGQYAKEDK